MLEYIFFDEGIRERFAEFVRSKGVEVVYSDEHGYVVAVSEDIDDDVVEALDESYDRLLQENAALLEETEDALVTNVAGVQVQLADGSPCMIRLEPELLSRMLQCLTLEEVRDLAQTIADGVANPDNRPLCHT